MKILDKLENYFVQRRTKKQQEAQKKALSTDRAKAIVGLKQVYMFVQFLNQKVLVNRKFRKDFWSRVSKGENLVEKQVLKIIEAYEKKNKEENK